MIIENVECVSIERGMAKFTFPFVGGVPKMFKPPCNVIYSYVSRNVKIGDTGKLVYKSSETCGMYSFEKYETTQCHLHEKEDYQRGCRK